MMNGLKNNVTSNKLLAQFMLIASFFGTLLLPSFQCFSGFPKIELSDFFFPFLVGILFFNHSRELRVLLSKQKNIFHMFGLFIVIASFSIVLNGRIGEIRDWFEILKYAKFFSFLIFFVLFFSADGILKLAKILFIGVAMFNVFHYFNYLNFNQLIEPFYAAKHHLDFFGLNSLGQSATKRAIGSMGNPNNNGFMFLLFFLMFLPRQGRIENKGQMIFSVLAILGLFASQSRSVLIAYVFLMILYFIYHRKNNWRSIAFYSVISVIVYYVFVFFGNSYLTSIGNVDVMRNAGIGRLEQWVRILNSMPSHWLFGHGPDKQYFEVNGIYAESEYFLILFRYGIVGLISFLSFFVLFSFKFFYSKNSENLLVLLFVIGFFIVGITNSPFHSVKLNILIAFILAYCLLIKRTGTIESKK